MTEIKIVREPKQKRSSETCERIRRAALTLFCRDGYYRTTTNAIAKEAGVPIGSLYSYFANKDALFLDILADYHEMFVRANEEILLQEDLFRTDIRAWMRALIESLICVHEKSRDLNREIKILAFSRPDIADYRKKNEAFTQKLTYEYMVRFQEGFAIEDIETTSVVAFTFISSIVDYLVFDNPEADRTRIIDTAVEWLYRALG
jgi:AcrR family transcriptional regulator